MQNKHQVVEKYSGKKKIWNVMIIFMALVATCMAVGISIRFGASNLTYATIFEAIFHFDEDNSQHIILHELRIPRAIAALLVGSALAVSGAIMQGVTRNALASPSIMGVTAGASFIVAIALAINSNTSFYILVACSFIGR